MKYEAAFTVARPDGRPAPAAVEHIGVGRERQAAFALVLAVTFEAVRSDDRPDLPLEVDGGLLRASGLCLGLYAHHSGCDPDGRRKHDNARDQLHRHAAILDQDGLYLVAVLMPGSGMVDVRVSGKLALEIVLSVRSRFILRVAHDALSGFDRTGDRRRPTGDSRAKRSLLGTISN